MKVVFAEVHQQHHSGSTEITMMHLAKTGYITGEVMWFKIYVLSANNHQLSPISKIAYIDVLQENGEAVFQQKIEIQNGAGDGSWVLPNSLSSGTYLVRTYLAGQRTNLNAVDSAFIQIINPTNPTNIKLMLRDSSWHQSFTLNQHKIQVLQNNSSTQQVADLIQLTNLQDTYPVRSSIKLNVSTLKEGAALSVAVYKLDGLEYGARKDFNISSLVKDAPGTKVSFQQENKISPPEYNGHFITGTVQDKVTGKITAGIPVYLSVSGERFYFGKSVSDENGMIRFDVGKPYGAEQIVVQLPRVQDSNIVVQILSPYASSTGLPKFDGNVFFRGLKNELEERVFYSTIDRAFDEQKSSTFFLPNFNDSTVFYGMPDKTYFLDDYTRFNTMEEVLREYVTEVDLRKSNQQFKFSVLDIPNKKSFENNPLVLIDGVPTSDINKVVAFDPLKVKRMDIVSRKFFLGDQSYDGIVSFITYGGDLGGYVLDKQSLVIDYPGLVVKRQFNAVQYLDIKATKYTLPDLRVLLHWDPYVELKKNQQLPLAFYTSDIEGEYMIEIRGILETGQVVTKQHYFLVVK